jgi:hypothetical protein
VATVKVRWRIERNRELNAALKSPDVVQQLKDQGIDAAPTSPAEFTRYIAPEEKKWGQASGNRTSKWSNDSQSEPFTNVQRTRHGRHR